jgi:hypothetical protein
MVLLGGALARGAEWVSYGERKAPVGLETFREPVYTAGLALFSESEFGDYGEAGLLEILLDWEFAYYHDILGGVADMSFDLDAKVLTETTGLHLPNQLVIMAVDAGWNATYSDGFGFIARIRPGFYADLEEFSSRAIYTPFTLAWTRQFSPSLSGVIGAEVRSGFDRWFMPVVGVTWEPSSYCRIKAQLPESRIDYVLDSLWSAHAGFKWTSTTYALREKSPFDREELTLEDYQLYLGASRRIDQQLRLGVDVGGSFDRKIEFKNPEPELDDQRKIDVDSALFVRVSLSGPF